MTKLPPPFTPLSAITRTARVVEPQPSHGETVDAVRAGRSLNPTVTITAEVTIPHSDGYAKRLNNLLRSLQASLEEEAPWLANIEMTVSVSK